jgi:hypothetical protein
VANEEAMMARKAAKKKAAKKPARKASKKTVRKKAKKQARKTVRKAPKRSARKTAAIESIVRSLDSRPESELASELDRYELDPHSDMDVAPISVGARSLESLEAVAQWRVAKSLLKLRAQVNARAPNRNKASDGTIGDARHCSRPNPTSDHCPRIRDRGVGVVAAMDITHDPGGGCDAGALANAIHRSRDSRVKYIIWNRKIANSSAIGGSQAWAWRPYNGANPHSHHVHISVKSSKPQYDSEAAWTLPGN